MIADDRQLDGLAPSRVLAFVCRGLAGWGWGVMGLLSRFRCHQWMADRYVCRRCGATKAEIVEQEFAKRRAAWPEDARRTVDRLTKERDAALSAARDARSNVFAELNAMIDEQYGRRGDR